MIAIRLVLLSLLLAAPASAETCYAKPDQKIEKKSGHWWRWRQVDDKKCWFYSARMLPKEDLIWSYDSKDYDSDVRVLERKPLHDDGTWRPWMLEYRWGIK